MTILEYRFNETGETTEVRVAFNSFQGETSLSAQITLTEEYVKGINDKLDLDRMNKSQIETYARRYVRDWIMTNKPENTETTTASQGV